MQVYQKNRFLRFPYGELRAARYVERTVVETDGGVEGTAVYPEGDHRGVGNNHGAHGEVVWGYRRDDETFAHGGHDGASHAERVGGRTGRGGEEYAVAAVGSELLPVHEDVHVGHVDFGTVDGKFVQCVGVSSEIPAARDMQHRPRLYPVFAPAQDADNLSHVLPRRIGQKSEVSVVDAEYGNPASVGQLDGFEEGAVAAVTEHDRPPGQTGVYGGVPLFGRNLDTGLVVRLAGEFVVRGPVESAFGHCGEDALYLVAVETESRPRKQNNFIHRAFFSNFTAC